MAAALLEYVAICFVFVFTASVHVFPLSPIRSFFVDWHLCVGGLSISFRLCLATGGCMVIPKARG